MRKSFMYAACLAAMLAIHGSASALMIEVDIIDATQIEVSLSGTLDGPAPDNTLGILFIDTPVSSAVTSSATSITGDAMLGTLALHSVFSGFSNPPYGGSLQLRWSLNGVTPLSVGDVASGTAAVTFGSPHGMTQSMFDGVGVPVYWGFTNTAPFFGTPQGHAMSPSAASVSEPSSVILALGLLAVGGFAARARRTDRPLL